MREESLLTSHSLLRELIAVQAEFVRGGDARQLFERLLLLLREETASECAFLGAVPHAPASACLQALVSTPPGWMDTPCLRASVQHALATGQPVSSAGPATSLLLLPLEVRGERVGLVGFANRPGGYGAEVIDLLQPLLAIGGSLLHLWRDEQRRHPPQEEPRPTWATDLERSRLALAAVGERLWDWNLSTRELRVSRHWLDTLGYTEGELEPALHAWKRLCHPEDLPRLDQAIREFLKTGGPHLELEYRARRKDGGWAWFLCRGKVVARDEQGRPVRMMGADLDISPRKRGEERMNALISAIPDLFFRLRGDGTYIDFAAGSTEELVLDPNFFIGKNLRELPLPQHFIDQTLVQLERAIREGELAIFEYEMDVPQGRQSYEARLARSGPDEAVGIVRNITERKQAEERQAQLIQSEKLASLGQLAAGIAHEINNPVSYVTSNLRVLDRYVSELKPLLLLLSEFMTDQGEGGRALPEALLARLLGLWNQEEVEYLLKDIPELIQESLSGTQRITEIVQSLRTFTRKDAEEPQPVDLNAELESTLRMVWNALRYKAEVQRDLEPLPPVNGYPTQLSQVFTNLLVNAAQAIETRGQIRVRTRRAGEEAVVEISDTGKGMTPETLSKLFTPFFTTKPRGQGTGLGLSISYGIIARHGGRIEVQSEPGKGSTFTLYIPFQKG